ncbi:MAG: hypothetical protein ACRD4Q_16365 [Candidatus Acidiferrales bacterium]
MRSRPVFTSLLPFALAGLLLAGGCNNKAAQNNQASANAPQQASAPAPPPDQAGGATAAPSATPGPSTNGAPAATPAPVTPQSAQNTPPPQPPPNLVIPRGTHISVTTHRALGSKISEAGETFTATVARPIVVNGQTAIPRGARATGTVVEAKSLGRFKGEAHLELQLEAVRVNGGMYRIRSNGLERVEQGKGKRSAGFIGGGAGLGAIIGGIAGGGKGALIGGLVGGGAGTAGAGLTGKKDIYIPAETTLTFRLTRAVSVSQ